MMITTAAIFSSDLALTNGFGTDLLKVVSGDHKEL
jgi:hypothetical protein